MENEPQNEAVEEQTEDKQAETNKDGISFESQSELDSFMDKKVSKAIETARGKWEEEAKEREDKAKKLARMTEADRIKAEQADRDKELSKREQELKRLEYSIQAKSTLAEAGLPNEDELVSLILSDEVETTNNNINYLKKVIADSVNKRVDELSKQKTPSSSSTKLSGSVSIAELAQKNRVIK
ncbi:DUF4355 domain-containing protein [Fructobacillus sp. M1-13]|uniref:DUF4355 domain-containing protein n=1 Tax=Fructobacillus papyriferae TaxID=2713171 RepID=A0ABS5QPB7_9LACO|nr:DUF4355 domain-containing protein [Fructobacillus papyriferae]MBS9335005.1 DUF4355 domain-containing protein [Fructobacillus papyriferae]MCD2159509.1 DUF4355 domain-containing protein [Fructobacillus papyriferae]